jgi:hypothetical protein
MVLLGRRKREQGQPRRRSSKLARSLGWGSMGRKRRKRKKQPAAMAGQPLQPTTGLKADVDANALAEAATRSSAESGELCEPVRAASAYE